MNQIEVNETKSTFIVYNATLLDSEETFSKYSPFQITKFLNTISNEWDWISYSNNGKVFTFKDYNENNAQKYEKISTININNKSIAIAIQINKKFNQVKGVIYSKVLISMKDEEILESLKTFGVDELYRFIRNEKSTGSFAITFNNKQLPQNVKIAFLNLTVYPLFEKPMQCLHCNLLGHTRKRCLALNENFCKKCCHSMREQEEHICIEVCKNCRENHFTNSKSCPAYTKEKLIIQMKSTKGISYKEAKRRFNITPLKNECMLTRNELNELENVKIEKEQLEKMNIELREFNKLQLTNIQLLTKKNEILNQQNVLLSKKYEILNKVLIEAKKSTTQNPDINNTNEELRKENENLKSSTEGYIKQIQTTKYYAMYMKKFIDNDKHMSVKFKKFMEDIMQQSDSSDPEYEDQETI